MGRITSTRGDQVIRQPDVVGEHAETSQEHANELIVNELINLAAKTVDLSRPVDEYRSVSGNVLSLEVLPDYELDELIETIIITANPYVSGPAPSTPNSGSVLATGVAQQNTNTYPVQVVISANGATITNVSVNGITVGTAAGTYTVPAFGSISVAYTVATPTWVWTNAGGLYVPNTVVLQLGDRVWNITMPPWGVWSQDGMRLRLARHDRRIVTQSVSGPLTLNLCGHADMAG
jgi:hypothetical protein